MTSPYDYVFCIDCKWLIPSEFDSGYHKCRASEQFDLVTGESKYSYCSFMRSVGACGEKAVLFELNLTDQPEPSYGEMHDE
jgi:hypothetical protein